jgi:glycosyltransferase involved in cell wall biosynthesis
MAKWPPVDDRDMASSEACFFTIFTPTYNRAATLPRVYESAREQTFRDFEWLIVDDNSEDETADLVESWQQEADFPIRFFQQDEPGLHHAHNLAAREANGQLLVEVDSDDELTPTELERLHDRWMGVPEAERADLVGLRALCVDGDGTIVGEEFPEDGWRANFFELEYEHPVAGHGTGAVRVELLREFPLPTPELARYVPESYVWSQIGREREWLCINEGLEVYHDREADRSDQLTQADNCADAGGFVLWHAQRLNEHIDWFWHAPRDFLLSAGGYTRHALHVGQSYGEQFRGLRNWRARLLWLALVPVGTASYLLDRYHGRGPARETEEV